ncbi:MAG: hypothetical protein JWR70_1014 [Modestobacter sp.]|nr:hypothetical protein [Modestobacter sp.]
MPTAQYRVQDATDVVARVDVGWPAQRLALEYDGLRHAEPVSSLATGNGSTG